MPRSSGAAAVRRFICAEVACAPHDLELAVDARGKPRIVAPRPEVAYSVSHTGSLTVVAVMRTRFLGVDIERQRPLPELTELVAITLSPNERAFLDRAPEEAREARFLAFWTRKEACLKALGYGVTVDLTRMEVASPTGWLRRTSFAGSPVVLFVSDLPAGGAFGAGMSGAVAADRPVHPVVTGA
jgi:4'-phosphopantetheinyl transferase